ncbi:MAG: tetratricopeptide repeat protein [Candidatus Sericytochromatia bacterium]
MSSSPLSLFRNSWLTVVLGMSGLLGLLGLTSLAQLLDPKKLAWMNWNLWSQGLLLSWLLALAVALVVPWLLLSFYGEWLYTRPLPRAELFGLIWREYLKWGALVMVPMLGLIAYSQGQAHYTSGSEFSWELAIFAGSLSCFGSLVLASSPALLRRLLPAAGLLVLWLMTAADWKLGQMPLGKWLSWAFWLALVAGTYFLVSRNANDLALDRPGLDEDENRAMVRLGLFRPLHAASPNLKQYTGITRILARLRLVSEHPRMVYTELLALLACVLIISFAVMWRYPAYQAFNPLTPGRMLAVCGLAVATLALINPRFMLVRRWEFLASRPLRPVTAYLAGWGLQGLMLLGLALLGLFIAAADPLLLQQADLPRIAQLLLFLWLGGELVVAGMSLLTAVSLSFSPALALALLAVLHGHDWPALALWLTVIGFRVWELLRFTGLWEPARTPLAGLGRQLRHYLPPAAVMLSLSWIGIQSQPLPRFLSLPGDQGLDPADRLQVGLSSLSALYSDQPGANETEYDDVRGLEVFSAANLRPLIANPHDTEAARTLARILLTYSRDPERSLMSEYTLSTYGFLPPGSYLWEENRRQITAAGFWLAAAGPGRPGEDLLLRSQLAEREQDFPLAMELAAQAVAIDPDPRFGFQLAHLQKVTLRSSQALASYQRLAKRYPAYAAKALLMASSVAREAGEDKRAFGLLIQAGEASPDVKDRNRVLFRLLRFDYERLGMCPELGRLLQKPWAKSTWPRFYSMLKEKQVLCAGQLPADTLSWLKGHWYLRHGQPQAAVKAFRDFSDQPWRAWALLQAGRRDEALAMARYRAQTWTREGDYQVFYRGSEPFNDQLLVHRILLELEPRPSLDSGLQVLMRSPEPDADWPLIARAYAKSPAELARMQELRRDLTVLDRTFAAAGQLHPEHNRSLARTQVQLLLAAQLPPPLQTPELKQAVTELQEVIRGKNE